MTVTKPNRVMIIGMDGATLDLIGPWAEAGILPNFKRLMREGAWGKLRSTMPPITPAAWSSFITGMNPGKHGVFEFTAKSLGDHKSAMISSTVRQAPSLWQLASQGGKKVIVYNVPVTYPPERVNGVMVSGLMTPPGAKDATYPPELQKELEQIVPGLGFSQHGILRQGHEDEFVQELLDNHAKNFRIARYLLERNPWDLFVMVFQHTDSMGHLMWKYHEDKGKSANPAVREAVANAMLNVYRDADAKLGELIKYAGDDTVTIVMSDHGHGRMEYNFAVNTWLLQKGYIKLKPDALTRFRHLLYNLGFTSFRMYGLLLKIGLGDKIYRAQDEKVVATKRRLNRIFISMDDVDWSRTRAYSHGYCGPIFVNLKGRQPTGIVEPGKEYEKVLDDITRDLQDFKEPGTNLPLFPEVHRGHDIYSGPFVDRAPDLLFFPRNWRYNAAGRMEFKSNELLTPTRIRTGTHRMDGILFMSGPGIRKGHEITGANIVDIAPTTLSLLGLPVLKEMDGRVLEDPMTPELARQISVQYDEAEGLLPELVPVEEMSPEDEEILVTRLRNLGYIA